MQNTEKTASAKPTASPGTPIAWRDVLRALGDDDRARRDLIAALGEAGASPDHFDGRGPRRRPARLAVLSVLVRLEDVAELAGARGQRAAIRAIRRRLESEVSP